ncbi:chemotaxis protein CheW [Fusibacter sp. JL298sf-3]
MSNNFENEPMLEVYMFETEQQIEKIEYIVLESEKNMAFSEEGVNEIFRCMHTIKGSSAMMLFDTIATVAHKLEDVFYFIREKKPDDLPFSELSDIVLEGVDFIKVEVAKIKNQDDLDGDAEGLIEKVAGLLKTLKGEKVEEAVAAPEPERIQYYIPQDKKAKGESNYYYAKVYFQEGCEMENIRAYTLVFGLTDLAEEVYYIPNDIAENEASAFVIRENGFDLYIKSEESLEKLEAHFKEAVFLDRMDIKEVDESAFEPFVEKPVVETLTAPKEEIKVPKIEKKASKQPVKESSTSKHMISVHVEKLDRLMNMVGELVISEAMVTQNPSVLNNATEGFLKSSRMLHKITGELQDMVMSIRMVPLSTTFMKMHRIVRDMCKKLDKQVELQLSGEETEVDKNIIEHISDPFIHIIRNAIDHGIEEEQVREEKGKAKAGHIYLEAKNVGSDVHIVIRDDGKGLNRERILEKAKENHLLTKPEEELSDREIYNLILLPGFSTKEEISEFSGRGVGMDVVVKKLESVGGTVVVESEPDVGTTITMKIPLTLAIVEGMNLRVGNSRYTVPLTAIKESFRPKTEDCIVDPDGNEMVMVRGECFPILRLHALYGVKNAVERLEDGILIMVEQDERVICLFADELLGQQQVVVKSLPEYVRKLKNILGLSGCTLLGDGSISLILDIAGLTGLRVR